MMMTLKEANLFFLNQKIQILNKDEARISFNLTEDPRNIDIVGLHQKSQGQKILGIVENTPEQGELFTIDARIPACKVHTGLYVKYSYQLPKTAKVTKTSNLFSIDLTNEDACRSGRVVLIAAGVGGGLLLLIAIVLVAIFLRTRISTVEKTSQAKVDINPLYNTYYAGDERMENRTEVNLSSSDRLIILKNPQVYDHNVAYYGTDKGEAQVQDNNPYYS